LVLDFLGRDSLSPGDPLVFRSVAAFDFSGGLGGFGDGFHGFPFGLGEGGSSFHFVLWLADTQWIPSSLIPVNIFFHLSSFIFTPSQKS
jgi:hypothetical protein